MIRKTFLNLFFASSLLTTTNAAAQETPESLHPLLDSKFTVSGGAFLHSKQLKIGVDGSGSSLDIDFDKRWNFDDEQIRFAGELLWRFGEKWSFRGQYFDSSDKARGVLDEDINWGDYTLNAGSNVGAGISSSVARLFFGRDLSVGHRHEFGLGVGVHWMEISAFVDGELFLNDVTAGVRRDSVSASAPLPNIGAWYSYAVSSRWLFNARADWFSASIGEYDGGFANIAAGIQFQAFEHFGVGLNYQYFTLDVDVDKSSWHGSVDVKYDGPFLYATANW